MSLIKLIKHLTPEQAWEMFSHGSVELFISLFHYDVRPVYDIEEMCSIYARDMLNEMKTPYTDELKEHLAGLFLEYINAYIAKMGGYENLKLFTEEEIEAIEERITQELLDALRNFKKPER
ncbi:MAG TPA: hypothetical protein GX697_00970 [Firmicutes bacterium]|nr:hypothetical protein [Bacillota bacterium]